MVIIFKVNLSLSNKVILVIVDYFHFKRMSISFITNTYWELTNHLWVIFKLNSLKFSPCCSWLIILTLRTWESRWTSSSQYSFRNHKQATLPRLWDTWCKIKYATVSHNNQIYSETCRIKLYTAFHLAN